MCFLPLSKREATKTNCERQTDLHFYPVLSLLPSLSPLRVVDKLPGPNILLLRNILCVLHHITERADTNKMDANNLALCIAPTLLQKDTMSLDVQTVGKVRIRF